MKRCSGTSLILAIFGAYQRWISPALPAALQVPPDLLGLRRPGGPRARPGARRDRRRLARCCAATRSATGASTTSPTASSSASAASAGETAGHRRSPRDDPLANILQPLIDVADCGARRSSTTRRPHLRLGDRRRSPSSTRALILPLSVKQIRSMRAMQAIQPQLKEIQEKYKDDRERLQREMMRFFQEHGVNPFASCLPLLLQLPVFISLFYLLRSRQLRATRSSRRRRGRTGSLHRRHHREGDGRRADRPDRPLHRHLADRRPDHDRAHRSDPAADARDGPADRLHPFMIGFPAGLLVYWISTNVWTMGQQAVVKLFFPPPEQPTPEEVAAAKPPASAAAQEEAAALGAGIDSPVSGGEPSRRGAAGGARRAGPGDRSSGSSTSSTSRPRSTVEEERGRDPRPTIDGEESGC